MKYKIYAEKDLQKFSDNKLKIEISKQSEINTRLLNAIPPQYGQTRMSDLRTIDHSAIKEFFAHQDNVMQPLYDHESDRNRLGSSYVRRRFI